MILPLLLLLAETQQIQAKVYYNSFDHRHPVLARIKPGDMIVTRTLDAGGYDENGKKAGERGNPLTGPFFIEGAEPGDALEVKLDRLRMNRNYGFSSYRLGLYAINPESIEGLYSAVYKKDAVIPGRDTIVKWDIDLEKQRVRLSEPKSRTHRLDFAAVPMLGCIGTAAAGVSGPTSAISGPYGGNLDYNRIGQGATVILPVTHAGGLLFLGDAHALQGDGEPSGTGVETSMEVAFTVTLRKKASLTGPRVVTNDAIISIGSQPEFASSLDRALRLATSDMVDWLVQDYRMEPWAAHMLVAYQGRYDVVTVAGSMALRLPKSELPRI
ncbi:MAG: acetamidase/formamidase family protein [Bryobacteraceae bacterium]|nr:acetamidase/formamidase family protein [Bryobacteraceae bacterium]